MTTGRPSLKQVFHSVDQVESALAAKLDWVTVRARMRLVQELIGRLPHRYLPAATGAELKATMSMLRSDGHTRKEMKTLRVVLRDLFDQLVLDGALPRHPLRKEDATMPNPVVPPESGLAVGLPDSITGGVASLVEPLGFALHPESSRDAGLDRAAWFPFSFVVCAFPIDAPATFLDTLRGPGSVCRSTNVVLVAKDSRTRDAELYVGRGANRVVPMSRLNEQLCEVIAELAQVSERIRVRMPVRVLYGRNRQVEDGRCENISRTGMLLRTNLRRRRDSQLDLQFILPGSDRPIHVRAIVVRMTTFGREDFAGLGVRFLSFSADGQYRLERFLQ
jgi:hypothetical protein